MNRKDWYVLGVAALLLVVATALAVTGDRSTFAYSGVVMVCVFAAAFFLPDDYFNEEQEGGVK